MKANKEKTAYYILALVAIVGIVGVAVLLMNSVSVENQDITGMAMGDPNCYDSDGGLTYTTQGTISGGTWKTTNAVYPDKTDSCHINGKLLEYYCSDATHGFFVAKSCAAVVGAGYTCASGACVNVTNTTSTNTSVTNTTNSTTSNITAMPDLVLNSSASFAKFSPGIAYIFPNGSMLTNTSLNVTLAIKNQGTATASGGSYSSVSIKNLDNSFAIYFSSGLSNLYLPFSSTYSITQKYNYFEDSSFVRDLYTNGSVNTTMNYSIDYMSSNGVNLYGIPESNETNNNGTLSVSISSSGITWVVAECSTSSDCASGCSCSSTYSCSCPQYPDLIITGINSVSLNQTNGNLTINFTVKNDGTAAYTNAVLGYYLETKLAAMYNDVSGASLTSSQISNTNDWDAPTTLTAGNSFTRKAWVVMDPGVVSAIVAGSSWPISLTLEVDYSRYIVESDEYNNNYAETGTLTSADLVS